MKNKGVLVIVAIVLAIAGFLFLRSKGVEGSAHFKVGDYIRKKNAADSAVWIITSVNPDLKNVSGSVTYTGAYYGRCVKSDAHESFGTTFLWSMQQTENDYQKIAYKD
jgi:hypothetical protein